MGARRIRHWRIWLCALGALTCACLGAYLGSRPAAAQTAVDLELVIAVDVSVSMDIDDQILQREGFIAAFRDPEVVSAIRRGRRGRIAVTYVEWSGSYLQWVRVPWMVVHDERSASMFADSIHSSFFTRRHLTSMSGALIFASALFDGNGFTSDRRVIDISGDGPNNDGAPVQRARDHVVARGITINGLPIMQPEGRPLGFFEIPDIDQYFKDCVIGGEGAFTIPVRSGRSIIEGIKQKLMLEIAGAPPRARILRADYRPAVGRYDSDCQVGERLMRQWWDSTEHD